MSPVNHWPYTVSKLILSPTVNARTCMPRFVSTRTSFWAWLRKGMVQLRSITILRITVNIQRPIATEMLMRTYPMQEQNIVSQRDPKDDQQRTGDLVDHRQHFHRQPAPQFIRHHHLRHIRTHIDKQTDGK